MRLKTSDWFPLRFDLTKFSAIGPAMLLHEYIAVLLDGTYSIVSHMLDTGQTEIFGMVPCTGTICDRPRPRQPRCGYKLKYRIVVFYNESLSE